MRIAGKEITSSNMKKIFMAEPVFNGNEKKYLDECIDTRWVSANGRFVKLFEEKFAEFCGVKYAMACANGTAALHLALKALNIKEGDEVIMPSVTYIATANAVVYCGAKPVFVDIESDTWNIDVCQLEKAINNNTKAILPVHLYGLAANMDQLIDVSEKYGIPIIEDAAEAHGAKWGNKKVGSFGKVACFSFFGNKVITCGEGGMVVTDDEPTYERLKFLQSQGVDPNKRYWHMEVAYNYRMTNMQAAVGLAQLEKIDWHLEQRKRVANLYLKYIKDLYDFVEIQKVPKGAEHIYWMFSIRLKDPYASFRDQIMDSMESKGIEMRPVFYPLYKMPPYLDESIHHENAEMVSYSGINLPTHALLSENDVRYVVDCLYECIKEINI